MFARQNLNSILTFFNKKEQINLGFKKVFFENYFISNKFLCIPSDYYGTLENMPFKKFNYIILHITWEYDTFRKKGLSPISKKLNFIKQDINKTKYE